MVYNSTSKNHFVYDVYSTLPVYFNSVGRCHAWKNSTLVKNKSLWLNFFTPYPCQFYKTKRLRKFKKGKRLILDAPNARTRSSWKDDQTLGLTAGGRQRAVVVVALEGGGAREQPQGGAVQWPHGGAVPERWLVPKSANERSRLYRRDYIIFEIYFQIDQWEVMIISSGPYNL